MNDDFKKELKIISENIKELADMEELTVEQATQVYLINRLEKIIYYM